jgi:hypothetical protein
MRRCWMGMLMDEFVWIDPKGLVDSIDPVHEFAEHEDHFLITGYSWHKYRIEKRDVVDWVLREKESEFKNPFEKRG